MEAWGLLTPEAEPELHKTRLLTIDERPFKRITKTLTNNPALLKTSTTTELPNPELLKEDFALEFSLFDNSLLRLQFLQDANERERTRYRDDQERILKECQTVRDSNAGLREQLEAARRTLSQRKKFDEIAEKITSNKLLKPREEQVAALAKLEEECAELEKESETYSSTFKERRQQFNRIMEESMVLRRQIRDEKEEVDRREGMNEGNDDDAAGTTPRPEQSRSGTPAPGVEGQAKDDGDDATPQPPASNAGTPMHDNSHLHPGDSQGPRSRDESRQPSQPPTPAHPGEGEDEEMQEAKDPAEQTEAGTPQVAVEPPGERMEVDP